MTEIEQLREALEANNGIMPEDGQRRAAFFDKHKKHSSAVRDDAAATLLKLYEDHPGIQEVIDGTHWVAPNEPTEEMAMAGRYADHTLEAMGDEYPSEEQSCINIYQAMRKASEK